MGKIPEKLSGGENTSSTFGLVDRAGEQPPTPVYIVGWWFKEWNYGQGFPVTVQNYPYKLTIDGQKLPPNVHEQRRPNGTLVWASGADGMAIALTWIPD